MPKFPDPPGAGGLAARLPPDISLLAAGTRIWRIYSRGGHHPTDWDEFRRWGPAANMRFDPHSPPPRKQRCGILYASLAVDPCFAEVFQMTRTIERSRNRPWLVAFDLVRDVRLLDLTGTWPTKAGASMAIGTGRRDRARRWSERIYGDYPDVEGLLYGSSMDSNRPAVALYERAQSALPGRPVFHRALRDAALDPVAAAAAARFDYDIAP